MKIKLSKIVEGMEFQSDESQSYLNKSTGEIILFSYEEINAAERGEDISDQAEWYIEAVGRAKAYLANELDYISLPKKYEFHEYRVMEKFIFSLPIDEQRDELLGLIKGKGAFSRFREGLDRFLLKDKWFQYRDKAFLEFARSWCQENNIEIEIEKGKGDLE